MSKRWWIVGALACLSYLTMGQAPKKAPEQPLPYSHKLHVGTLQLKCKQCHTNPDPGFMMTYPSPSVCKQCHAPEAKQSSEVQWVRVYKVPAFVYFGHRTHLDAGAQCADCHGKVAEREQIYKEGDISMGGCMNCHRLKKASLDCNFCHDPL